MCSTGGAIVPLMTVTLPLAVAQASTDQYNRYKCENNSSEPSPVTINVGYDNSYNYVAI